MWGTDRPKMSLSGLSSLKLEHWAVHQDFDYIMVQVPCLSLDGRADPQSRKGCSLGWKARLRCDSGLLNPVWSHRNRNIKRKSWVGG